MPPPSGWPRVPPSPQGDYPGSRPVTLVVAWAPGGSTDFVARVLAQGMSAALGGNVVVDNRPGASGTIGHASVARARPDGYTLLLGVNSTYAMARHLFPQRGYDDEKSFAGIGRVATTPIFLCASNKLGVTDIKGFVAKAKAQAGKLSYASSGAGSSAHLATELFLRSAGIEVQNVTYKGGAPAVQALISGEVEMAFVDAVTALPLIAAEAGHRDRRLLAAAQPAGAGGPDHRRERLSRLRVLLRLRAAGAGRHAAGDHPEAGRRQGRRAAAAGDRREAAQRLDLPGCRHARGLAAAGRRRKREVGRGHQVPRYHPGIGASPPAAIGH